MNIKQSNTQKSRLQQGFTLIEVLVSMVILSIGLLGLAGPANNGFEKQPERLFLFTGCHLCE